MARKKIRDEIRQLRDEMTEMVNDVFNKSSQAYETRSTSSYRRPVMEITEQANEYLITVELPGAQKEDIELSVSDNVVTVNVSDGNDEQHGKQFYRRFTIPRDANGNEASASYSNGVLEIRMPAQDTESHRIKIQ